MDAPKLNETEIADRLAKVEGWEIQDDFITKEYEFDDFQTALAFVNTVGEIAETADHHPDIMFGWGYAEIAITSHEAGGLTEDDFALAAKIDELP